jgi:hypothetical protein
LQWKNADVPPKFCINVIGVALWIMLVTNIKSFLFYSSYSWSVPWSDEAIQHKLPTPFQGGSWAKWIGVLFL